MRVYHLVPIVLLVLLVIGLAPAAQAAGPYSEAALGALAWVAAQQQPDGGFPGFGAGATADAVFAICAVQGDPNGFLRGGESPITYLAAHVSELTTSAGTTAKTILALVCAGKDPRNLGGVDLVAQLEATYNTANGRYGTDLAGHTFAMLALTAVGRPIQAAAITWLRQTQTPEGGWSWSGDPAAGGADTNSAALAIQALVAAGVPPTDPVLQAALTYLHGQQNADGGFPYAKPSPYGSDSDADSTAYVIQALVAAGQDPEGAGWTMSGGKTPQTVLWALQLPSGALQWQAGVPGENALATYQAIPALMLRPFPLARTTVGPAPALLPATGVRPLIPVGAAVAGLAALWLGLVLRRMVLNGDRQEGPA